VLWLRKARIQVSVPSLQAALLRAATDSPFRARARRAGPLFAARRFSLHRSADTLLGVLQDDQWANWT
jgi:hypothetical protein